jgi:hypothetical protein
MAFRISSLSPMAIVSGLCIIMVAVGAINTFVPDIAITLAAEAAIPLILTVTSLL